jgi:hypothetical protein
VNANANNYEANFSSENIGLPEPENNATGIGKLGRIWYDGGRNQQGKF